MAGCGSQTKDKYHVTLLKITNWCNANHVTNLVIFDENLWFRSRHLSRRVAQNLKEKANTRASSRQNE